MFHYVLKGLTHRNTGLCYVIVSSYWFYQHDDDGQIHELILNIWSPKSCSSKMPEEQPGCDNRQTINSQRKSIHHFLTGWQRQRSSSWSDQSWREKKKRTSSCWSSEAAERQTRCTETSSCWWRDRRRGNYWHANDANASASLLTEANNTLHVLDLLRTAD